MTTTGLITRTAPFWMIFAASTLGGMTNAASTPIIPVYVEEVLGGGTGLSGVIISLAALTSMIAMPVAGLLADRARISDRRRHRQRPGSGRHAARWHCCRFFGAQA